MLAPLLTVLLATTAPEAPTNAFSFNLAELPSRHFQLGYERVLMPRLSAFVLTEYHRMENLGDGGSLPSSAVESFGWYLGVRVYPLASAPFGLFMGVSLLANSGRGSAETQSPSSGSIDVEGIVVGAMFQAGFTLHLGGAFFTGALGGGSGFANTRTLRQSGAAPLPPALDREDEFIMLTLAVGYAFGT